MMHHPLTPAERDAARCCGSSVGALARRRTADGTAWEYLLIGRAWWPIGWAPVAGHVWDAHTDVLAALVAELREEAGLFLLASSLMFEVDLGNLCQAPPSLAHGHHWWVFRVDVTGELAPDMAETTGARWVPEAELQAMADTTMAHALAGDHARDLAPTALEAVWVELMARAEIITATPEARVAVARLYSTPPDQEWIPTA
ncbi:NUDIX hydrolase [Nocardiopsis alba]|uniref:NUDIX hydrolase n=1 Tax=Nocardiopsis alba TaxID=53437 RepID=UPI00366B8F2C